MAAIPRYRPHRQFRGRPVWPSLGGSDRGLRLRVLPACPKPHAAGCKAGEAIGAHAG